MDDNHPPGSPPFKPKKLTTKGHRPARRDSPNKPGAPVGPQLPAEPSDTANAGAAKELAFKYSGLLLTETLGADALLPLISNQLEAPSLEGLDPESISLKQASEGIKVLIPSADCLMPGDEFNLMWGSRPFTTHTVNTENIKQPIMATEWVIHSRTSHLRQGKVKVCYDVYREGQRIGTSAILDVYLHDTYLPGEKQQKRKQSRLRKQQRQSPQKR